MLAQVTMDTHCTELLLMRRYWLFCGLSRLLPPVSSIPTLGGSFNIGTAAVNIIHSLLASNHPASNWPRPSWVGGWMDAPGWIAHPCAATSWVLFCRLLSTFAHAKPCHPRGSWGLMSPKAESSCFGFPTLTFLFQVTSHAPCHHLGSPPTVVHVRPPAAPVERALVLLRRGWKACFVTTLGTTYSCLYHA